MKKWYEIEFSPTTFHKRSFKTEGIFTPIQTESSTQGPLTGDRADIIWETQSQVYIENTTKSCAYVTQHQKTAPPCIHVTIEDLKVQSGEEAKFEAVIEGNPTPEITWYKGGVLLSASDRVYLSQKDAECSLTLRTVSSQDRGIYTCVAKNISGEVSCKAELSVYEAGSEEKRSESSTEPIKRRKLHSFYEVKEEIGRGSFGFVKRVIHKGNRVACAAKFIPLRTSTRAQAYQERDILSRVSHPRIACLLDVFETRRTLVLILDICSNQELLDHLLTKGSVTENEVKVFIHQVLEGIEYLHNKNILHLDIKPTNILMVPPEREEIRICDFGLAQQLDLTKPQYSTSGSPEFVAPEIVCQSPVSKATDIWSIGVLAYLCLTCTCPFSGENDRATLMSVREGRVSWDKPDITSRSSEAQDFIKRVLQVPPEKRPSASDCLGHQWFQGNQKDLESEAINMKRLKFFVSRSKWQRSLMCYKSVLVMRSIADLLDGVSEDTSLAVPRHQLEENSSSSASSSDYEDTTSREKDPPVTPELQLPVSGRQFSEEHLKKEEEASKDHMPATELETLAPSRTSFSDGLNSDNQQGSTALGDTPQKDVLSEHSEVHYDLKRPVCKAAIVEVAEPSVRLKEPSSDLRQGSSEDSALCLQISEVGGGSKETSTRVPRHRLIKSMFSITTSECSPASARHILLQDEEYVKNQDRTRKHLMRTDYKSKSLSGLREPLLEHIDADQNRQMAMGISNGRHLLHTPVAMAKSNSFDTGDRVSHYTVARSRRSRSLGEYTGRASTQLEPRETREVVETCEMSSTTQTLFDENKAVSSDVDPGKLHEPVEKAAEKASQIWNTESSEVSEIDSIQHSALTNSDITGDDKPVSSADNVTPGSSLLQCIVSDMVCLSEEIDILTESGPVPDLNVKLSPPDEQAVSRDAQSESEALSIIGPVFVESTTPKSVMQEVSDLLNTQYGFSQFKRPKSFHLSLKALEMEVENRSHFLKASSEGRIKKSSATGIFSPVDESPKKEKHSFQSQVSTSGSLASQYSNIEPFDFEVPSKHSTIEPMIFVTAPEETDSCVQVSQELVPVPLESKKQCPEDALFDDCMSASGLALDASEAEENSEVETERLNLFEDISNDGMYPLLDAARFRRTSSIPEEDISFPVESTCPTDVNVKQAQRNLPDPTHQSSSTLKSKPQSTKPVRHGLFQLFRKSKTTEQPSKSTGNVSPKQTEEEKNTESGLPLSLHQQQQKASDLSITKKVKASVSSISRAVWGKQACEKDRREEPDQSLEQQDKLYAGASCSLKRRSGLFSFKLPAFKKNKAPSFVEELLDQVVSLGQSVTMSCRVTGHPPPEIRWYKEGCQFLSSSRILLSAIPKECHTLTILSAEEEDLGSYRCVATNPGGEASTSCTLIVSELPTCLAVPEVTQVDGDGALLVWKPLESSEPVTYSIQYSTEGGEWRTLAEGVADSCYTASKLSVGAVYSFRVGCVNKAGMGPYSEQSAETTIGEEHEEWHIPLIRTIPPRAEDEDSKPESRFPLFPMHETYTFLSEINRGRFSIIKQCRGDLTQKLFAAKVTPYKADKRHLVLREYQILKRLRHTHVVQLQAAFITLKYLVLIEELCAGQELLHNLAERDSYSELEVREFLLQILSAVQYLHSNHILHLDLKSDNMVVTENNVLKIVDFGCAQAYTAGKPLIAEKIKEQSENRAPEILEGKGVGPETDIWSIGVLTFVMLSGDWPFASDVDCKKEKNIKRGKIKFGRCYPGVSEGAMNFVKCSLNNKPWGRPSASDCVVLPWLCGDQASKQRHSVVSFPTAKLHGYLREREKRRAHHCTKLELPIQGHFSMGNGQSITLLDGLM